MPATSPLPPDLLTRTPEEALRRLALDLLAQAAAARDRLADASDAEALHDFRVAIRRLRSTVRAYRGELQESVGRKAQRRLRDIARATGGSRDLEVQLEWLDAQRGSLNSRHRPGAAWLRERMVRAKREADARLGQEAGRDFDRLRRALARKLPVYWLKVRLDAPAAERRFATLLATRLRAAVAEFAAQLAEIGGPEAIEEAHEARLAGKRVRYLLEPVVGMIEGASKPVKRLKALQDVLGELHDLDVLLVTLDEAQAAAEAELAARRAALAAATASDISAQGAPTTAGRHGGAATGATPDGATCPEPVDAARPLTTADDANDPDDAASADDRRALADRRVADRRVIAAAEAAGGAALRDPSPGLQALARRARSRREAVWTQLATEWLPLGAAALVATLDGVAATLDALGGASAGTPVEIERKYLLRGVPHLVRGTPSVEIAQGWLPGERLLERVRRVRRGTEERYYRTVKLGRGLTRVEIEEETTRALFDVLWPATRERRIHKRRHAIADGERTWEIDVFVGRELVLAEVELPAADAEVELPDWLAPYVVREVTEDAQYVNANLAAPAADEPRPERRRGPRVAPGRGAAQVRTILAPPTVADGADGGAAGTPPAGSPTATNDAAAS